MPRSNFSFASRPSRYSGMEFTPRQFNALLAELKRIREHLHQLRDAVNDQKTATESAAQAYQQKPEPAPQIHAALSLPKTVEDAIAKKHDEPNGWQKANVLTSGATAFFTLLAFIAAFWYACEAHQQTPKIAESADAAKNTVAAAREATQLDQRAWIGVGLPPFEIKINERAAPRVRVFNSGKTPAYIKRRVSIIEPLPKGQYPVFTPRENTGEVDETMSVISPGSEYFVSHSFKKGVLDERLNPLEFNAITKGDIVFYIWGQIDYEDIFYIPHWIQYCSFVRTDLGAAPCPTHNDTDRPPRNN